MKTVDALRENYEMMRERVTLDGKPAVIVGWHLPFPIVRNHPCANAFEYSRETIARVLANGGGFKA